MKILLYPFSLLYGLIVFVRNLMYDLKLFKINKVSKPVISVGNLTVGGTGKTPVVAFVTEKFLAEGKKIAILSRGYKRKTKGSLLVSDGKKVFTSSQESGDEPFQLANRFRNCIIAVDEKRSRIAKHISENFNIDLIILDDGFQHRKLKRNFDLVILDFNTLPYDDYLLPSGNRREMVSSLRRANCMIINKCKNLEKFESICIRLKKYSDAPIFPCVLKPQKIHDFNCNEYKIDFLNNKKVIIFSGIAKPENFEKLIVEQGANILKSFVFKDHHYFREKDIDDITKYYQNNNADLILTTEKDYSRLSFDNFLTAKLKNYPIYYLIIELEFLKDEEKFLSIMKGIVN